MHQGGKPDTGKSHISYIGINVVALPGVWSMARVL